MAVRFTSSGNEYIRTFSPSLGSVTQFTVCCWARIAVDTNNYSCVWSLDAGGTSDYYILETTNDGTTMVVFSDAAGVDPLVTRAFTVGTWYFIGVSVNGTSGTMLTRSLSDSSFTVGTWDAGAGASGSTSISRLRIGNSPFTSGEPLNGNVAAFKAWTGASLTQAEMENEAWTTVPNRTANLLAWYPFSRAEAVDYSGNGNTLSGGSGATTEDGPGIPWGRVAPVIVLPTSVDATAAMPAVSATVTVPQVSAGAGAGAALPAVAASASTPAVAVSIDGGIAVQMPAVAASTAITAPSVSAQYQATVTLPQVVAQIRVPPVQAVVPVLLGDQITGEGQIEYNGVLWGGGDIYRVTTLSGWDDLPPVDNGNTPRASRHGAYAGRKLAQARDVTTVVWMRDDSSTFGISLDALIAATAVADADTELPLVIRHRGEARLAYGMVTARASPPDDYGVGTAKVTIKWSCSDPRRYGLTARGLTVPMQVDPTNCINLGNTATHPLIHVPGPAENPVITNETLDRVLGFDITLGDGETLDIDCDAGIVTLGDASKMSTLNGSSVAVQDFVLGAGDNLIGYDTDSGGTAGIDILWRDSYL